MADKERQPRLDHVTVIASKWFTACRLILQPLPAPEPVVAAADRAAATFDCSDPDDPFDTFGPCCLLQPSESPASLANNPLAELRICRKVKGQLLPRRWGGSAVPIDEQLHNARMLRLVKRCIDGGLS